MRTVNIAEGVNLRLIDGSKFTHTTLSVLFRQNLSKDIVTADSLLALMFLSGSKNYRDKRILEIKMEELEGAILDTSVIKKGNEHIIQIYAKFRPYYIEEILSVINDIIFNFEFRNEYPEKKILRNVIEGQINNKRTYAYNSFMENIYGDVNGDGYVDDIDNINLKDHYKKVIDESVIEIMAVCQNESDVIRCVKKYLNFKSRKNNLKSVKKLNPVQREYEEVMDVVQGKLCVGITGSIDPAAKDYGKLLVANDIFGGGSASKLFNEAREKENLCYYITSGVKRFNSIITVEAGIDSENVEKTIDIIKKALKETNKGNDDIELSKKNIISGYKSAKDQPEALMNIYMNQIMAGDIRNLEEIIECVNSVRSIKGAFDGFSVNTAYMLRGEKV